MGKETDFPRKLWLYEEVRGMTREQIRLTALTSAAG